MYSIVITICLILCSLILSNSVWCAPLEIKGCRIDGVEIGSNVSELYSKMGKKYRLDSIKKTGMIERVVVIDANARIGEFQVTDAGIILQGEITANFSAPKNITLFSKLGEILRVYGKGKIDPTEAGYYVWFKNLPSISFLINNDDIPKSLRNIPDDAFNNNYERKILRLKNARIKSVRVSCSRDQK